MCTVKKDLDTSCDYEQMNRNSSEKLLSQIYSKSHSHPRQHQPPHQPTIESIHAELAQLRGQVASLQHSIDTLPAKICELLHHNPLRTPQSSWPIDNEIKRRSHDALKSAVDDTDDEDEFDHLSSSNTSDQSDIEILKESIVDANRELIDWCGRLRLNSSNNSNKPQHPHISQEQRPTSSIFSHWEDRYSEASQRTPDAFSMSSEAPVTPYNPLANYTPQLDKGVWLK